METSRRPGTRVPLSLPIPASRDEALDLVRRLRKEIGAVVAQLDREEDEFQRDESIQEEEYTARREATLAALATKQAQVDVLAGILNSPCIIFRADFAATQALVRFGVKRPLLSSVGS